MSGTVRRAGDEVPPRRPAIQIRAHTTEGQEQEPQSPGATLTDKDGAFRFEMPQDHPPLRAMAGGCKLITWACQLASLAATVE